MFWLSTKRIIKGGLTSFWRNGFVSLASTLVMTVTLFVIATVLIVSAILNFTLAEIKDKVDINVYLVTSASEADITSLNDQVTALPEVASIEYLTRDEVLAAYIERHKNDQAALEPLEELDDNPFRAALRIKAKEPTQYAGIADFLNSNPVRSAGGISIIDKVDYFQNKIVIDRLTTLISGAETAGLVLSIILVIISILITFNTIRLAIYTSREEIGVMRLVGANQSYVRGPFVVGGIIYGVVSTLITVVLLYPITLSLGRISEDFFVGLNVFDYYTSNFGEIFFIILGSGILIGAISSFLAVKRYLK